MTSTFKNFALEIRTIGIFLALLVRFLVNFLIWIFHRINYSHVQICHTFPWSPLLLDTHCACMQIHIIIMFESAL